MSNEFAIVATFDSPIKANIAKSRLEAAGIAAFLGNERVVETQWLWANAVGGVRLQVRAADRDRALAILDGEPVRTAEGDEESYESAEADESPPTEEAADDEAYDEPNMREQQAFQALKIAIFGMFLCPLLLLVPYYLARVLLAELPMRTRYRWCIFAAALIFLPYVLMFATVAYLLLAADYPGR